MQNNEHAVMEIDRPEADAEFAQDFEIGVCDDSFRVFARIIMRGADGVRRIESELSDMGYESVTLGTSAQLRGCDMLVVRRAPQAPMQAR